VIEVAGLDAADDGADLGLDEEHAGPLALRELRGGTALPSTK
jgi:hypothetical protein